MWDSVKILFALTLITSFFISFMLETPLVSGVAALFGGSGGSECVFRPCGSQYKAIFKDTEGYCYSSPSSDPPANYILYTGAYFMGYQTYLYWRVCYDTSSSYCSGSGADWVGKNCFGANADVTGMFPDPRKDIRDYVIDIPSSYNGKPCQVSYFIGSETSNYFDNGDCTRDENDWGKWDWNEQGCADCENKREKQVIFCDAGIWADCISDDSGGFEQLRPCEEACGAPIYCDERLPGEAWLSDIDPNFCFWCDSTCGFDWDNTKPNPYYSSGGHCYYGCSIACEEGGWTRQDDCIDDGTADPCPPYFDDSKCKSSGSRYCTSSGWNSCSYASTSCPNSKVSDDTCYYGRSCDDTSPYCHYSNSQTCKCSGCSGYCLSGTTCYFNDACTSSGETYSSCSICSGLMTADCTSTGCQDYRCIKDSCGAECDDAPDCDSGLWCLDEVCNADCICEGFLKENTCFIGGVECYNAGDANPYNSCQECDPSRLPLHWSNKPDGTDCAVTGLGPGECCSGVCDDDGTTTGSGYHAQCRSTPYCLAPGEWGYNDANDGSLCGGYNCRECSSGYCNSDDNSRCTGNCVVCNGNCAADNTKCTGNCGVCSGSGTSFSCAADESICESDYKCSDCTGGGTYFSCTYDPAENEDCPFCQECYDLDICDYTSGTDPKSECPAAQCDAANCDGSGHCQDNTADDGYLCTADCDSCVSGVCVNRNQCNTTECTGPKEGWYCDTGGGSCVDPNADSQAGENVCEACIPDKISPTGQHSYLDVPDWSTKFEALTIAYCCHNDANEYYVTNGVGQPGCCDVGTENCVDAGGFCRDEWSTEVTCDDGIDNDCDGPIDGSDPDCVITPQCHYCNEGTGGDTSPACGLTEETPKVGVAQYDEEWYWLDCWESAGGQAKAELTIDDTLGGEYELCIRQDQDPDDCPQVTEICVDEIDMPVTVNQTSTGLYWVLAHRKNTVGEAGFEITLDCYSWSPPDSCSDTDEIDGDSFQPKTRGTVSGYQGGSPYSYTDQCQDSRYLTEYSCSGTSWTSQSYDCKNYGSSYVCSYGRCEYQSSGGGGGGGRRPRLLDIFDALKQVLKGVLGLNF